MKYSSYKFSGADWLGEIPSDWKVCPLKYIFTIKKRIAGEPGHTVLSITQSGIKPKDMSGQGQFAQDYSNYQLVYPGDFAMNHMDLLTGWVDLSKYEGVTSPDYRVFINNDDTTYLSEYYKYIFQYCYSGRVFYGLGQGVSGFGRWRLPAEMFLNFRLPVPPKSTQETIVQYLNRKVAHIDSVIAEAKASIEEYKAWKASVIYEAVTKGLDPDVEMKDSGVDIIGSMPAHWNTCRLKYLCDVMTGNQDTQNADDNGEYPFYVRSPIVHRANVYTYEGEGILMAGDGAGAGRVFHHAFGKYAIHQRVYCFHNFRNINTAYFLYLISELFKKVMDKGSAQSTVPSVRLPMIQNFVFCIPSEDEQRQIVAYLNERCSKIDALISEKDALIADLESYKKSLIFEVVTGKRKVV